MVGFMRDYKDDNRGRKSVGVPTRGRRGEGSENVPGRHREPGRADGPSRAKPPARGEDRRDAK